MDVRCLLLATLLAAFTSGCTVSSGSKDSSTKSTTLDLGPMIGLIGMAVDGDDKDDYEHFFHDGCKCRKCRH